MSQILGLRLAPAHSQPWIGDNPHVTQDLCSACISHPPVGALSTGAPWNPHSPPRKSLQRTKQRQFWLTYTSMVHDSEVMYPSADTQGNIVLTVEWHSSVPRFLKEILTTSTLFFWKEYSCVTERVWFNVSYCV